MINRNKVASVAEEYLQDTDKFLVEVNVSRTNKVVVLIDGDSGVKIEDCVALSRHILSFFDRDQEDFELEVSSVGVGSALQLPRQYRNNIGRSINITRQGDTRLRGKLLEVNETGITIEKVLPKESRKKLKDTDEAREFIPFSEITLAKIQPSFK
jgi:ribosome maturation factor RimP